MNELREMTKRAKRIMAQQAKEDKARARYGIFVWRGDGRYTIQDMIGSEYKSDKLAQKKADRLNETNPVHVVRRTS